MAIKWKHEAPRLANLENNNDTALLTEHHFSRFIGYARSQICLEVTATDPRQEFRLASLYFMDSVEPL